MNISRSRKIYCLAIVLAFGLGSTATTLPAPRESLRLELFTKDLEKSLSFYTTVLGFEVERRDKTYASLRRGDILFGICDDNGVSNAHYFQPELAAQRRGLGVEIVIEVDNPSSEFEHVKYRKWPILTTLQKRPWGLSDFRIADPDGYYLRITSRE